MGHGAIAVKLRPPGLQERRRGATWRQLAGGWTQDLALAFRAMRRSLLATSLVLVTLALGIGATTAVFSVINATLLWPLPYKAPDRLMLMVSSLPEDGIEKTLVSYLNFRDWKEHNTVFEDVAAVSNPSRVSLTGVDRPLSLQAEYVSANYFQLLGVPPLHGRTFEPDEELVPGSGTVTVISHHLWQELFAGDPAVVGRGLMVNGVSFRVVGVMRPIFRGLQWEPVDLWLSIGMAERLLSERHLRDRTGNWTLTVARLREGVTLTAARDAMNGLADDLEAEYSIVNSGLRPTIFPLKEHYYPETEQPLQLLLAAAALVLLICCGNVATLVLTVVLTRSHEVSVRAALGASRYRLIRLFATHTTLLSLGGVLLGVVLAWATTGYLVRLSDLPPASFAANYVDLKVLSFAAGAGLLVAGALALVPAAATHPLASAALLRGNTRTRNSRTGRRLAGALVVIEIGLAATLALSAVLMVKSLRHLVHDAAGFDVEKLLVMEVIQPASSTHGGPQRSLGILERFLDEATALPGTQSATIAGPEVPPWATHTAKILADGGTGAEDTTGLIVSRRSVFPGYFQTLGVELLRGRDFELLDDADHPQVAILSQAIADLLWVNEDPVGQRFKLDGPGADPWWTVVGVVPTLIQQRSSTLEAGRDLYLPFRQQPERRTYLLSRSADPARLVPELRKLANRIDPELPVNTIETMEERYTLWSADTRFQGVLFGSFSLIAVLLGAAGIYGLLAFDVRQRRHELGVRLALGATAAALRAQVLRRAARLLAFGLGTAALGYALVAQVLSSLLYGVQPSDPTSAVLVLLMVTLVALCAGYLPAHRAGRVDPVDVLREGST